MRNTRETSVLKTLFSAPKRPENSIQQASGPLIMLSHILAVSRLFYP